MNILKSDFYTCLLFGIIASKRHGLLYNICPFSLICDCFSPSLYLRFLSSHPCEVRLYYPFLSSWLTFQYPLHQSTFLSLTTRPMPCSLRILISTTISKSLYGSLSSAIIVILHLQISTIDP